jgi:hypothetical protein
VFGLSCSSLCLPAMGNVCGRDNVEGGHANPALSLSVSEIFSKLDVNKSGAIGPEDIRRGIQQGLFGRDVTLKPEPVTAITNKREVGSVADLVEKRGSQLMMNTEKKKSSITMGIIRLDYNYPAALGDIDCPDTYDYDVVYRVVPGLTFFMCQDGKMTPEVEAGFIEAIQWLDKKNVCGITGDCGFMMYFQDLARKHTTKPVYMSALAQLPAVTCSYAANEKIAILTANSKTLEPMHGLIEKECGVDPSLDRFIIVGCEDVDGFEAVAEGGKVDVKKVAPGIVNKTRTVMATHPEIRAVLLECTELPPYADSIRAVFGIPVFDAITCCNFFTAGVRDAERFGLQSWQETWDHKAEEYHFGQNLSRDQKDRLVNLPSDA